MNEKLLNRIIKVAYGEASIGDNISIHNLAKKDDEVRRVLEEHSKIADQARDINLEVFPESILRNIKNTISFKPNKERSLLFDIYSFIFRRPATFAAILSVIILSLISTLIFNRPEIHQQYTPKEIEVADRQVKHSLALIASVFKKTSATVEKDILTDRVSRPLKESINLVNEYLEEDKNENIN